VSITPADTARNIELEQVRSQAREWKTEYERICKHFAALHQARWNERRHVIDQLRTSIERLSSGDVVAAKETIVKLLSALEHHRGDDRQKLFDM
jgi:hypothetical protein